MPISDLERRLVSYCESQWFSKGAMPTPELLCTEFDLSKKQLNALLSKEEVKQSFEGRGMPIVQGRELTPDQLTAINTILNFADTRSEKKKLADMDITPKVWDGWRRNPAFKEYMLQRTEGILGDSIPDVHMALVDRARNGDLGAIKMVYEMTGRYKQDQGELNPRVMVEKVFEIISLHVQDPVVLRSISNSFAKLIGVDPTDTLEEQEPPVAGVVIKNQIEGNF
jgi:hypothetical protein